MFVKKIFIFLHMKIKQSFDKLDTIFNAIIYFYSQNHVNTLKIKL
jgi:hypothetical protein